MSETCSKCKEPLRSGKTGGAAFLSLVRSRARIAEALPYYQHHRRMP